MPNSDSPPAEPGTPEDPGFAAYRRRLRFRCWHRGTREMDLILGGFADRHIETLSKADLDDLDRLLGASDPDVYNWISGRETPPPEERSRVLDLVIAAPPPAALTDKQPESSGEET